MSSPEMDGTSVALVSGHRVNHGVQKPVACSLSERTDALLFDQDIYRLDVPPSK